MKYLKNPFAKEVLEKCNSYQSNVEMFRAIFKENFFYIANTIDPNIKDIVEAMINCQSYSNGYTIYQCPSCGEYKSVPFTCKTRFCPSCGNIINMKRANSIAEKMFNVSHRHGVFTCPEELDPYFFYDRSLLHVMAEAATDAIKIVINDVSPKRNPLPGVIYVIHTFSRSSEWNPHIHCIFTVGGITKYGKWFPLLGDHVSYEKLRKTYQDLLLKKMRRKIGPSFLSLEDKLRKKYTNGFYVHAPRVAETLKGSPKKLIKYLARYLGRPCIASSRIDGYDGKNVYFHYTPHNDSKDENTSTQEKVLYEKLDAIDFMIRLIDHIPEQNFQMIGYCGIYANASIDRVTKAMQTGEVDYLYSRSSHTKRVEATHWRQAMMRAFNVDPLECPVCLDTMVPLYAKYKGRRYSVELGKKRKTRGKSKRTKNRR